MRELLEVQLAERFQLARPLVGEAKAYDAEVVGVLAPGEQPGRLGAIDEPDRAVVAQQEVRGNVAERRPAGVGVLAEIAEVTPSDAQARLDQVTPAA